MKRLSKIQRKALKKAVLKFRRTVDYTRFNRVFRGKVVSIYMRRINSLMAHWESDLLGNHDRWWKLRLMTLGLSYAVLFAIGLSGCASILPGPTPSPDWTQHIAGSCEQAGAVLELHSCPEAKPRGTTWAAFCSQAQASAGAIDLDVGCIAGAASLEAVRGCHVRCVK